MTTSPPLSLASIRQVHARIAEHIHRTPIMSSRALDAQFDATLFFKCENFQKVGAFKARGATNAVRLLSAVEASRGVVTHSSGNHGAALAWAAKLRGSPSFVVMPHNAPKSKELAARRYGAEVIFCEPTLKAREQTAREVIARTKAVFVHPYDDANVMAGQGTAALELLEDRPDLDLILCPVGGGGLLSGSAVAARGMMPHIRIVGVEPAGADDAFKSFKSKTIVPSTKPETIADGLRTSLGDKPFAEIVRHVDDIVTVSDAAIVAAMRSIWEVMKIVVEPSAAVTLASILEHRVDVSDKRVGLILTGGNLDLDRLPWQAGMSYHG